MQIQKTLIFFGINVGFDDSDISLKLYYKHDYSTACYEKEEENEPFINFLESRDMLNFYSLIKDSAHSDKKIYEVKMTSRTNENMLELFSFLENYITFFGKYKEEIIKLATMKNRVYDGFDYASFYFFSVIKESDDIKGFKCYWDNDYRILDDAYFFNFLEKSGV